MKQRGRRRNAGSWCRSCGPRLHARRRSGLWGSLRRAVGPFAKRRAPDSCTEGLRRRSEVCWAEKEHPGPAKSLPAADPSNQFLEGVPEETQDQQEKAGQDTDHRGDCSGAQTGANVGEHLSHVCRLLRFGGYWVGIPRTEKIFA
jgi:hypothetical protein